MKRLMAFCLMLCLLLSTLVACSKGVTPTDVSSIPSMTTVDTSFDFDDRTSEDKELTAKGFPPLPLDLQILYQDAQEMAAAFALCNFKTMGVTREIGNQTYDVISDSRFDTYADLTKYLQQLFTDDCIYRDFLNTQSPVQCSSDGLACAIQASGAADITYAGHVFQVDSYTTKEIRLTATVYYAADPVGDDYFFTTPKNPDDYTTEEMKFSVINTDDGWRFSQCPYLRK